jgi:hypothetical protein
MSAVQKKTKKFPSRMHDPSVHLGKVLLVAGVAIAAALFVFFLHWFSILQATQVVVIEPTEQGIAFIQKYFPASFFQETWRQQKIVWGLLVQGMSEALKSFGFGR